MSRSLLTRSKDPTAALVAAAGLAMLLLRPTFVQSAPRSPFFILGALYTAILIASLAVPLRPARPKHLNRGLVLGAGLAALGLGTLAAGTPVPVPWGAWALPIALLAAVAEEALFRRVAYGGLERWGTTAAVIGSALLFALVHVPLYGTAALPLDLGAGLLLSWQRWASGTWTVPAATHAAANLLAVLR